MSLRRRMFVAGKLPLIVAAVCLVLGSTGFAQEIEPPNTVEEGQISDMRRAKIVLSSWGQGSLVAPDGTDDDIPYFNAYLYEKYATKANIGCAATALGQVMRYFSYPDNLELSAFSSKCVFATNYLNAAFARDDMAAVTNIIDCSGDPRIYDFASMPLNPVYGEAVSEQMGALLYDAAVSLSSEFTVNVDIDDGITDLGSPTERYPRDTKSKTESLAFVLREKFAYSNAIEYVEGRNVADRNSAFHDEESMGRIFGANLDARQPVLIIYGAGTEDRHVAIVDGYGYVSGVEKPYYHINFCMGGAADGWYQLPTFKPLKKEGADQGIQCGYISANSHKIKGVVFNISPGAGGEIVAGRAGINVVDEELSTDANTVYKLIPMQDVEVRIFDPANLYQEYAGTLTEDANGVFVLNTDFESTTNVVLEARYMHPEEGPLVVEKFVEVSKNILGRSYTVESKDGIGNVYGVELPLGKAKVIVDGIGYASLERAIAAAETSSAAVPEIKIVDAVDFNSVEWTIARDMVITSTNSNPRLTPIMRKGSGVVKIHEGVNVAFSNVCFQALGDKFPVVEVSTNAVLTLSGIADIEVIKVLDDGMIKIDSALDESCSYKVDTSDVVEGKPFASSSRPASEIDATANLFIHLTDETLCGFAEDDLVAGGSTVKWAVREVPDSAAILKLEQGGVSVNYRSFGMLLKDISGEAVVTVVKDCDFTNMYEVVHDMTVNSVSGGGVVFSPRSIAGGKEGFVVNGGATLKFEDVVFTEHCGGTFVTVNDGGAFVLGSGAVMSNIVNQANKYGGAVDVKRGGSVRMSEGCRVCDVANTYASSYGGFMCLEPDSRLEIAGGTVERCYARGTGGAIYVAPDAELSVSGPAVVSGNVETSQYDASDVYVDSRAKLILAGVFDEGRIGVKMPTGMNAEGTVFASVEVPSATEENLRKTAERFYNNYNGELYGDVSDDARSLVWTKEKTVVHTPLEEGQLNLAAAMVVYPETQVTQLWERLDWAINSVTADAEVTLLKDNLTISEKLSVANSVLVLSDGAMKNIIPAAFGSRYDQSIGEYVYQHSVNIAFGASLTLTNVCIKDTVPQHYKVGPLFDVKGKLVLNGSTIEGGARDSSDIALNVQGFGELVLTNNSAVTGYSGLFAVARSSGGAISIFNSSVEGNAVGSVGGAAVVVGSDTSLCVGARASVAGNSFSGGALANVQLNASRLTLSSPLETEFYVTPNHIGGASYSIFGVVGFDYGGDLQVLSASASNFINDITLEKGVVVTNSAGSAYLAWAGAFAAGGDSVTSNGEKFYLAGARPELPPSILPAEPVAIAFVSIAKNAAGTHWQLKLTPAVEKCRYFLYAIDSLSDGFVLPADGAGAEQSFTATADGEFMFEVPVSADDKRFFKVLALPEALDR